MKKKEKRIGRDGGLSTFKKIGKPGMRLVALHRWHPELFQKDGTVNGKKYKAYQDKMMRSQG